MTSSHTPQPPPGDDLVARSDEAAVDRFAAAMKAKLKWEREERGRGGWDDPAVCSEEYLALLLVEHLSKGNAGTFEDVANFAMMLHQRNADPRVLAEALTSQLTQHTEAGEVADEIVTRLYRRFKDWSKRGFGPDDVTWCEVKADVMSMIDAATKSSYDALAAAKDALENDNEVLTYKLGQAVNTIQPMIVARAEAAERQRDALRESLRQMSCPRPCNGRPDDFTAGQCIDAGECGCIAHVAALKDEGVSNG